MEFRRLKSFPIKDGRIRRTSVPGRRRTAVGSVGRTHEEKKEEKKRTGIILYCARVAIIIRYSFTCVRGKSVGGGG